MRHYLNKILTVLAYVFQRKGFFTKRLVVSTTTLLMMLYLDIQCGIWNGMGLVLLVLLTLYVVCNYILRYMEMKKEDEESESGNEDADSKISGQSGAPASEDDVQTGGEVFCPNGNIEGEEGNMETNNIK